MFDTTSQTMSAARANMIDTQVRCQDVTDPRIHAAMAAVARERFVPPARRAIAYADVAVELAPGRFMLDPRSLAKALQLANGLALVAVAGGEEQLFSSSMA